MRESAAAGSSFVTPRAGRRQRPDSGRVSIVSIMCPRLRKTVAQGRTPHVYHIL